MILRRIRKCMGQSSLEYMVYFVIMIAVFLVMKNYFQRGVQGRWKQAVDDMGEQYDPRTAESRIKHSIVSNKVTETDTIESLNGSYSDRKDYENTIETKDGYTKIPD